MGESRHSDFGDSTPESFPGKHLLAGSSPREVMERLYIDDPLEIWGRSEAWLEREAVLMALDRLYYRGLARIAHAAMRYHGEPALEAWVSERIRFSLRELIEEDRDADRNDLRLDSEGEQRYEFLVAALGLEPQLARRACVRFNDQPVEVRRAFWSVVIEKQSIEVYSATIRRGNADRVRKQLAQAFHALGIGDRPLSPDVWREVTDGR